MPTTLRFPHDILRFLYWVFFKPITLYRYIHAMDPTLGLDSIFTLWRRSKTKLQFRPLILLALFNILVTPWFVGFGSAFVLNLLGVEVDWLGVAIGVGFGVALGVAFGVGFDVGGGMVGMALGVAFGVGFGVAFGMVPGVAFGVVRGVTFGVGFGAAFSVALVIGVARSSVTRSVAFGMAIGLAVVGVVAFGVEKSVPVGVATGVAFGVSFIISYLRLFIYIFQMPFSFLLARLAYSRNATALFRFSPVQWDELIWLPLSGLDQHLITIGKQNRQAAQGAVSLVALSFSQQRAARNALVELTAYDVERAQGAREIATIAEQLAWLPATMPKDLEDVLPPIREIAEYAHAALESDTLYNKQTQLRNARTQTRRVREGLGLSRNRQIAARFGRALEVWEKVFDKELDGLRAEEIIPNVYVAGSPLATNSKVFKGRQDLFLTLERELATPAEQRPALLLFGARRTGKTSAIKQMPARLGPKVIPVEIDLQSAAIAVDVSGLLAYIADQIKTNALSYRRVQLPTLAREQLRGDPYMTFLDWLKSVAEQVGTRWILLNLDEYEHLTNMMAAGRLDTRVLDFLRGLIQHHPRLTVLLSGSHTLEDLLPLWSDYLINVRVLKIGSLKEAAARELVVKPIEDFPLTYEPAAVDHVLAQTCCQPYLLQAVCRDLVNALNEQKRMSATLADTDRALDSVLTTGAVYFQELWSGRDTDDAQRAVMRALALDKNLTGLQDLPGLNKALRQLVNRDILENADGTYRFRVELVRRWVQRVEA